MGKQKKTVAKNYEVILTLTALKNIDEITDYIAFYNNQPLNASKVGDKIIATIHRIQLNPLAFKECQQLATTTKKYRRAICMSWQIIFKIKNSQIIILRIIHTSRSVAKI